MMSNLGMFGHHPDPGTDFCCEVDALEDMAYEVSVGLRGPFAKSYLCGDPQRHAVRCNCYSEWPFWGRLAHALTALKGGTFPHDAWTPGAADTLRQLERRVMGVAT